MQFAITPDKIIHHVVDEKIFYENYPDAQDITSLENVYEKYQQQQKMEQFKYCSFCGKETWACGHGGHCYSEEERKLWERFHGESTNYSGIPELNREEEISN